MAENGYIALFDMEDGFTPQQVRKLNWNLRRLQRAGDAVVREIGSGGSGNVVAGPGLNMAYVSGTVVLSVNAGEHLGIGADDAVYVETLTAQQVANLLTDD